MTLAIAAQETKKDSCVRQILNVMLDSSVTLRYNNALESNRNHSRAFATKNARTTWLALTANAYLMEA